MCASSLVHKNTDHRPREHRLQRQNGHESLPFFVADKGDPHSRFNIAVNPRPSYVRIPLPASRSLPFYLRRPRRGLRHGSRKMKETAQTCLGKNITHAVVIIPVLNTNDTWKDLRAMGKLKRKIKKAKQTLSSWIPRYPPSSSSNVRRRKRLLRNSHPGQARGV